MEKKVLILFFTFNVSLKDWLDKGLFDRETTIYRRMVERGWEIIFFTYGGKEDANLLNYPGITVQPMMADYGRIKSRFLKFILSLIFVVRNYRLLKTAKVIKTNQILGGWLACFASMISRRPLLARGGYEPLQFAILNGNSFIRRTIIRLTSLCTYRYAKAIILATHRDREFVCSNYRILPEKITVIGNWIDTEKFKPLHQTKYDPNTIFYIGRFDEQKNIPALIEAIALLGAKLHLAGDCRPNIVEMLERSKIDYTLLGVLPNDKLPELYNKYHIYCIPSFYEGNPKTLLEAMACGLAVVGSDGPGISDILREINGHIISRTDANALSEALARSINSDKSRKLFGEAARTYILEHHSLTSFLDNEENVLNGMNGN